MQELITMTDLIGINIRDGKNINFAELICSGIKTIETRDVNSLKPYINKRVRIIRTGIKRALIIGEVTILEPIVYNNEQEFQSDYKRHLVSKDSEFWIKENSIKYGYPLIDAVIYDKFYEATKGGIISRRNQPRPPFV